MKSLFWFSFSIAICQFCPLLAMESEISFKVPVHEFKENGTTKKFFWYTSSNGSRFRAFLEGGPRFTRQQTQPQFYLYNRANQNTPKWGEEIVPWDYPSLSSSSYIKGYPVKILIHGFTGSRDNGLCHSIKDAYMATYPDCNIICVDWSTWAASPWYDTAADSCKGVGQWVGSLVNFLWYYYYCEYEDVYLIGNSLGAHVAGFAGEYLNGECGYIIAADAASPFFEGYPPSERVDPTDAKCVIAIHSCASILGIRHSLGDVDFYPNGGESQPGCSTWIDVGFCSHRRCVELVQEFIRHPKAFHACNCNSWDDYRLGNCPCQNLDVRGCPFWSLGKLLFLHQRLLSLWAMVSGDPWSLLLQAPHTAEYIHQLLDGVWLI